MIARCFVHVTLTFKTAFSEFYLRTNFSHVFSLQVSCLIISPGYLTVLRMFAHFPPKSSFVNAVPDIQGIQRGRKRISMTLILNVQWMYTICIRAPWLKPLVFLDHWEENMWIGHLILQIFNAIKNYFWNWGAFLFSLIPQSMVCKIRIQWAIMTILANCHSVLPRISEVTLFLGARSSVWLDFKVR